MFQSTPFSTTISCGCLYAQESSSSDVNRKIINYFKTCSRLYIDYTVGPFKKKVSLNLSLTEKNQSLCN